MRPLSIKEGQRFGRLTVVEETAKQGHTRCFRCECDCGKIRDIRLDHLTRGKILSCGCYAQERRTKHGMWKSSVYKRWNEMRQRCGNPNSGAFKDYGGRGITVCERWHKFENFIADVGMPSNPRLELDRINNDGNYEPGNVRWSDPSRQKTNQRKRANCTSRYRGVCWNSKQHKWQAEIKVAGRRRFLGHFDIEDDAGRAYDSIARMHQGFTLNFPETGGPTNGRRNETDPGADGAVS